MKWNHTYAAVRAIALSLCLLTTAPLSGADISYVYDNLGRLLAVIDPASDTAVYAYDAVGNLTGITRQASSTLAILQFTPSGGPVGTSVTIYGTGFSATPASNTVKFNGTTATVATASTTVLTTTVPTGCPVRLSDERFSAESLTDSLFALVSAPRFHLHHRLI